MSRPPLHELVELVEDLLVAVLHLLDAVAQLRVGQAGKRLTALGDQELFMPEGVFDVKQFLGTHTITSTRRMPGERPAYAARKNPPDGGFSRIHFEFLPNRSDTSVIEMNALGSMSWTMARRRAIWKRLTTK